MNNSPQISMHAQIDLGSLGPRERRLFIWSGIKHRPLWFLLYEQSSIEDRAGGACFLQSLSLHDHFFGDTCAGKACWHAGKALKHYIVKFKGHKELTWMGDCGAALRTPRIAAATDRRKPRQLLLLLSPLVIGKNLGLRLYGCLATRVWGG